MSAVTATRDDLIDMPALAKKVGRDPSTIRKVLLKNPTLDQSVERRWGRRLFSVANVKAIEQLLKKRTCK